MKKISKMSASRDKSIAVIEEIAENIYSIKFILQSLSYRVRSFSSREDYLAALQSFRPDLIVVDMLIPDGGGFRVLQEIRSSALKEIPMLAIAAEAMEGNVEDAYQAGATEVLLKPYTVTDLQEKLEALLAGD